MTKPPVCAYCKHFNVQVRDRNVCAAFPAGIPEAITLKGDKHLTPVEGDHGLRFDPLPGFEEVAKL